jgi:hypothetical protein
VNPLAGESPALSAGVCDTPLIDAGSDTATDESCGYDGRLCDACLARESTDWLQALGGWASIDRELNARRESRLFDS